MEASVSSPLWYAAVGALSGAHTLLGPVFVTERFRHVYVPHEAKPAAWLKSRHVGTVLHVLSAAEMLVDKLPMLPPRTAPVFLVPRALAGAMAGAALSSAHRRGPVVGGLLGAVGALAGAAAALRLRVLLLDRLHVPNMVAGIGEDLLLFAARRLLLARV